MDKIYYLYTHTSPSGKVYVGQTINPKKRWSQNGERYKYKRKDGRYVQPVFARALDKYGWEAFTHKIILECSTKSEINYAEKYLIQWYKLHNISYNITDGGEGTCGIHTVISEERRKAQSERLKIYHPMRGKHHTPEAMAKIVYANRNRTYTDEQRTAMAERARIFHTGRKASEESKRKLREYKKTHPETWIGGWNAKEVFQYDIKGNFVASYHSAMEASVSIVGKERSGEIFKCIAGEVSSALGFIWRDIKTDTIDVSNYKTVKTKKGVRLIDMSYKGRMKRRNAHGKPVNQYSLNGDFIKTYSSITEASENVKIERSIIGKCCSHKRKIKTAGGFLWKYDNGENRIDKRLVV